MKRYLIIYHREDNDGLFSAAICENYIRKTNADDVKIDKLPSDWYDPDEDAEWEAYL